MAQAELNIEEIIGKVYFKIATWHNDTPDHSADENKTRLYGVSYQIIETVLAEVGMNLGEKVEVEEGVEKTQEQLTLETIDKQLKELREKLSEQGKA